MALTTTKSLRGEAPDVPDKTDPDRAEGPEYKRGDLADKENETVKIEGTSMPYGSTDPSDAVPEGDTTLTVVKPTKVDKELGVDPANKSADYDRWLEEVKASPMVRDDGMTKSPTAPDDGILKSPPEKTDDEVQALMLGADAMAEDARVFDSTSNASEFIKAEPDSEPANSTKRGKK